ncbi:MAG TPA: TonB-dependent receptor [Rhodospirillales bacterium]
MTLSRYALAVALCMAATPALAEHAPSEGRTIIVIASVQSDQAEARANRTPGGANVVSHEDYADKSLVSLRDTLGFTPGVYLQPRYGQEIRISIRGSGLSRGFHMRGLTLLQDGVPINLADENGDFQELEPIFFDHLEVYRGANALRFGSGTLGGAINGVTPTGRTAPGLYTRLDLGTFDTARLLVSGGFASGGTDAWFAGSADASDGDRDHARRQSLRFHGNMGFTLSDAVTTRFYASYNAIDQELPGALNRTTALSAPKTGNFAGDQGRDIDSVRIQNRTSIVLGDAQLDVGLFYNAKSLYHPIYQVVDQDSEDLGAFFRANYAAGPFELTIGGETRHGTVDAKRFVNVGGARGDQTFAADQKARTSSLYAELRYQPVDALTLVAGGIYADGYRRQHESFNSAASGVRDVRASATFDEFSPKFGLLIDAAPNVQLYANYSRSAEFPGFIELAQVSQFVPVKAQHAWTMEVGSRGKAGIASWDVSAYRAELKGELLQFSVGPDVPAPTFNAGRTRHQGIEAALSLEPASWLRVRQVYQYANFRFRNDAQYGDNRLPVMPRHSYRGEVRFGSDALHVAPNLEWVPQGAWANYQNSSRTPGYALIGMTAGARVRDGVDLFLDARNLTGKKAIGDISATISATTASVIYYPVERRAVFAGVRARF